MANVTKVAMIVEYGIIAPSLYIFNDESEAMLFVEKMNKDNVTRISLEELRVYTAIEAVDAGIQHRVVWEPSK